jgi:serine/threonine protein kinase
VNEDLWSVGATAFALLAGRPVYEGVRRNEQLALSSTNPAPVLAELAPEVPVRVCAAIQRALERDAERRWQTASELRAGLEEAVTGHALESARRSVDDDTDTASVTLDESDPVADVPSERVESSRRTAAWGALLLMTVVLLACVVWWFEG